MNNSISHREQYLRDFKGNFRERIPILSPLEKQSFPTPRSSVLSSLPSPLG